jgi:hypothetical protein
MTNTHSANAGAGAPAPAPAPSLQEAGDSDLPTLGPALANGLYRHYKGGQYEVLGLVRHSETLAVLVLYRALYGERGLWVRPRAMFDETVDVDGRQLPRFAWHGPAQDATPQPGR